MANMNKVAKEIKKAMTESDNKKPKAYDTEATVSRVDGDTLWVNFPGSENETPVRRTIDAKAGDVVMVRVANHRAWTAGNQTSPPTDDSTANRVYVIAKPSIDFVKELKDKDVTVRSIAAATGYIDDLYSKNILTENLQATTGYIIDLISGHITAQDIIADHETVGSLDATYATIDELHSGYAEIDLANVNNAWLENGLIKDAAISDAQILDVSANKLTTGTIDAGKINVINLNADNLTVGTINGQRIGNASIDLNKLSQEVPTKEYLESVKNELQNQIDGAINTWTGADVPTLDNYPASGWSDARERGTHIGDIYYVVDEESEYNGYCYRFVAMLDYDGSVLLIQDGQMLKMPDGTLLSVDSPELAYKWVLIKDSDVTKALRELVVVQGDVSGLKTFESNTSSWMTNTDSEISSLKSRATSLETNIGNKVDVTTFNEVKQTVDENSASITTLQTTVAQKADNSTVTTLSNTVNTVSQKADANEAAISTLTETVDTKADGSTVQTLSNTVNTISQTATGNASKIENLTTTLGTNADGTTKAGDIVHRTSAVEQDLSGFKTTVSETYHRTSDFNTFKTANDTAIAAAKKAGDDAQDDLDSYKTTNNAAVANAKKAGDDAQADLDAYKTTVSETYATKTSLTQTADSIRSDVSETYATKVSVPTSVSQLTNDSGYVTTTQAQGYADMAESNAKADTDTKLASYSTTAQMNSAIDQKANQITQTVSETYQTISDMSNYSTTSQMNSAIDQKAGEITTSVSSTYETKTDATSKLNTANDYTDTEITSAKATIKVTTDNISSEVSRKVGNDEVISRINQSAESVRISASKVDIEGAAVFNQYVRNDEFSAVTGNIDSKVSDLESDISDMQDILDLGIAYQWGASSVTVTAVLIRNGEDIHEQIPASLYEWEKETQNVKTSLGTGWQKVIPRSDINYMSAVTVYLTKGEPVEFRLPDGSGLKLHGKDALAITV